MLLVIGINTFAVDTIPSNEADPSVLTGYSYLQQFVGTWEGTGSIWEGPDTEPVKNFYVTTSRMIMGGNFLESKVTGVFWGMPFEGTQLVSYSSLDDQYTTQWMTNLNADVCTSVGTLMNSREAGAIRSDVATVDECPICPEEASAMRTVTRLIDNDHFSITQYITIKGSHDEFKFIEITYTRTN
jgi:hypothetical protein